MLTNLVRVCVPHFKYIVAGTKSLNARQSVNTSVSSDDITQPWNHYLLHEMREEDVWCLLPLELTSDLLLVWNYLLKSLHSFPRSWWKGVCMLVYAWASLSAILTTLTNCLFFWGFLHCCILSSGCIFLYSIPVYPLSPLSVCSWTTFLYKHRRRHQYAYSLRLLVALSSRIIAIKASAISANALWSPLSLLTMDMPSMMYADEFELCYFRSHLGWGKIGTKMSSLYCDAIYPMQRSPPESVFSILWMLS